ncbi:hypothetical protein [Sedimenticola selenatireducens]|uniref:MSHA biogenesis protein MshI n=1 Tax=Sedimenticola selenatireducens TaxID=191960 RepID=A0A558DS29_9GAMM|nr:hypothetical protein [Sedimenticola selenatireducens]TVO75945.1 hypothetical protein FHP88_08060 [Sedimenticola selenatireducens]TVT63804.1 MAG: hypothetical protein FHK78_10760 [Sedimenticola selenatireducens]
MLKLKKRVKASLQVGVGFHADGFSLTAIDCTAGKCRIEVCTFFPRDSADDAFTSVHDAVKAQGLRGVPAVAVLSPGDYSLFQVEVPEVEHEELKSAIRWRIKDLLDFHIDDAVLDIFDLPVSQRRTGPRMMYVVVAKKSLIQTYIDQMQVMGFDIAAIDITELTLRNVLALSDKPDAFQALLYLPPRYGMIEIVQGDTLYLNRRIEINGSDLEEQGGFGLDEQLESLVLELQRSLDYHESQFGLGLIPDISIIAPESRRERLREFANESLAANVTLLDLNGKLDGVESIDASILYRCLPAIGAALRSD